MSKLGNVIKAWQDSTWPRPADADIARRLGVTKGAVGGWIRGATPKPEHLRALSTLTRVPYDQLLTAALVDAGYLKERDRGHHPAATTQARGSRALDERDLADVLAAVEVYFDRASAILRTQRGRGRDAMLDELRDELRRDLSGRLAEDRPDSARDVG